MDIDNQALWWRGALCAASAFNLLALALSVRALGRRRGLLPDDAYALRRLQLILSAGYALGCAYRSALPVYDIQRLCMVDSWFSSVVVGRCVATFAELCFAAQWALLMREASDAAASRHARWASTAILPLIALAELCSWHAVLTTSNFGHVIEESLWGGTAALIVAALWRMRGHFAPALRPGLHLLCVAGALYVAYMFMVDVPRYWTRWLADEAARRPYLDLLQGLADASSRWIVSHRWSDWRSEVDWMTLYFTAAVWLSIALVHAPALRLHARRARSAP